MLSCPPGHSIPPDSANLSTRPNVTHPSHTPMPCSQASLQWGIRPGHPNHRQSLGNQQNMRHRVPTLEYPMAWVGHPQRCLPPVLISFLLGIQRIRPGLSDHCGTAHPPRDLGRIILFLVTDRNHDSSPSQWFCSTWTCLTV